VPYLSASEVCSRQDAIQIHVYLYLYHHHQQKQYQSRVLLVHVDVWLTDAGYGHIAPKTALGRVVTIIYATFGIPLTLLTIAQVGGYMAVVFRFTYKNLMCGLGAGACTCCRSDAVTQDPHVVTENPHDVTAQTSADRPRSDAVTQDPHVVTENPHDVTAQTSADRPRSDAVTQDPHVVTENLHNVTAQTSADHPRSDKSCSSPSPTHNHLPVEGHDRAEGQGQGQGHEENSQSGADDELVELKIIKGEQLARHHQSIID